MMKIEVTGTRTLYDGTVIRHCRITEPDFLINEKGELKADIDSLAVAKSKAALKHLKDHQKKNIEFIDLESWFND